MQARATIEPIVQQVRNMQAGDHRSEFAARLSEALKKSGQARHGAGSVLATLCGVTTKGANKWLNGDAMPEHDKIVTIATRYGVRAEWLEYGIEPMMPAHKENHTQLGVNVAPDWTTAQVPIMDQAFSAGQGAAAEKLEDFVDGFKDISHSDLTALNIQPNNARIIKIRGDSMWSTLWDGDEVLADTYVPRLISGKIYAFEFDGELKVKRFTKKMDGSWLISSDNKDDPAYTDEVVSAHNAQQLRVIAEVKKLVSRNL